MSGEPAEAELRGSLRRAGVQPALAERLAAFGAMLLEANAQVNLTGAACAAALLPHLLDALTLAGDVRESLADVGSGGGLPGIPLALATGARVGLIEASAKKAAFLEQARTALGFAGEVIAERAEVAGRDPRWRERFAYATARAVGPAPAVAELTLPFVRIGGRVLLQRGPTPPEERRALADAATMLGGTLVEERTISGGERRVFVVTKAYPTTARFPRRNGVPAKRPLGRD